MVAVFPVLLVLVLIFVGLALLALLVLLVLAVWEDQTMGCETQGQNEASKAEKQLFFCSEQVEWPKLTWHNHLNDIHRLAPSILTKLGRKHHPLTVFWSPTTSATFSCKDPKWFDMTRLKHSYSIVNTFLSNLDRTIKQTPS